MEKKEAVREYCIEKAIQLLSTPSKTGLVENFTQDDVIDLAKKIEKYILE